MQIEQKVLQAAVTAIVSADGSDVDVEGRSGAFVLDVTAASGTTPTLDVLVQELDVLSGKYFTLVTFAQKTAVGNERLTLTPIYGGKLRVSYTITGSSPSFTFTVGFQGKEGDSD